MSDKIIFVMMALCAVLNFFMVVYLLANGVFLFAAAQLFWGIWCGFLAYFRYKLIKGHDE